MTSCTASRHTGVGEWAVRQGIKTIDSLHGWVNPLAERLRGPG